MLQSRLLPIFALLCVLAAPLVVQAHGPTPQKVEQKIQIAAEPAKVWLKIKDFSNIAGWHPMLAKSSGDPAAIGAKRVITLKTGGDLEESIDEINEDSMELTYRLSKENPDAFPVSFYSVTLAVQAKDGGSEVSWRSRLYRADTTNEPPEDKNDATAVAAMTEFFTKGLEGLKTASEVATH